MENQAIKQPEKPENLNDKMLADPLAKGKIPKWSLFFSVLVLLCLLFLFFRLTEIRNVINLLQQMQPGWFLAALAAQIATYMFTAATYYDILSIYGRKDFSLWELSKLAVVSLFVTQVIPTAGISGNGYIAAYFNKKKLPPSKSVLAVSLEIFTFYAAHLLVLALAFIYLACCWPDSLKTSVVLVAIFGAIMFILLIGFALLLGSHRVLDFLDGKKEKKRWIKKLFSYFEIFEPEDAAACTSESVFRAVLRNWRRLGPTLLWQTLLIFADAATVFFILLGFGFRASIIGVLVGLMLTKIIAMVSFTPGSLVFFEGAMVLFYSSFGIPLQLAVISTVIFRALSFWLPMPFGLLFYRQLRRNGRKKEELAPLS